MGTVSSLNPFLSEFISAFCYGCIPQDGCVCACVWEAYTCAHMHGTTGCKWWVTNWESLTAPCTYFWLNFRVLKSHYMHAHVHTHTHSHTTQMSDCWGFPGLLAANWLASWGIPTLQTWVSTFSALPFIYQQLNFDYHLPYAASPLPFLYHYTSIAILGSF